MWTRLVIARLSAAWLLLALAGGTAFGQVAKPALDCDNANAQVKRLLGQGHLVDTHLLAQTIAALCPLTLEVAAVRAWDAVALARLEDGPRAREILQTLAGSPDGAVVRRARVLKSWSFWLEKDTQALTRSLRELEPQDHARLRALRFLDDEDTFRKAVAQVPNALRPELLALHKEYDQARSRSPGFAGVLSALLPGAGQAYAGSWEGAAVSFLLNGILIGATVELARNKLYWSAGATGLAASIFYVGGIINAADLAHRYNDTASAEPRLQLERTLVPEAFPAFPGSGSRQ